MNKILQAPTNLRSLDLRLLVAFDALLSERHVTRAAQKVGLTQPAMSNALNRLRHVFKDELFIRAGSQMEPTSRALELAEPIREVLRKIERVLKSDETFDPVVSDRIFTLRMSDLLANLILPDLLALLGQEAPRLNLDIVSQSPAQFVQALEADQIDAAVSMGVAHSGTIRSKELFRDRFVCVLRRDHPATHEELSVQRFLRLRHIKVSVSMTDSRFIDDVLSRQGLKRDIAVHLPHWLATREILSRTDLALVAPERLARSFDDRRVAILPLPIESEPFCWNLYWHRRHDGIKAHRWMREMVQHACQHLRSPSESAAIRFAAL